MTKKELNVIDFDGARVSDFELKNPVLKNVHPHLVAMTKVVLHDEIETVKRARSHTTNPSSTKSQKFWNTSDIYRGVCSFAIQAAIKNTSTRISFVAKELSTSLATVLRICNQAEEAGYIEQFNKGVNGPGNETTIRASEWQLGNYIKLFTLWKLTEWSKIRERYQTVKGCDWFDELSLNQRDWDDMIKSFDKWSHDV